MKIPKTAVHLVVALEGLILAVVLVLAILHPLKHIGIEVKQEEQTAATTETEHPSPMPETDAGEENSETENEEGMIYSEVVREKVLAMSLEEKIAQMFVTTPEQLTDMRQVTATGTTSKRAVREIPVGGLLYAEQNFEGRRQTSSMTEALQTYYKEEFGFPLFLMVEETGGEEHSPLAQGNDFPLQPAPEEVGAEGDTEIVFQSADSIATYMKTQGLNTNIGLDENYSTDSAIAYSMLDAAITAYKEAGIYTASRVYHAKTDIVLLGKEMPIQMLRQEQKYEGILLADNLSDTASFIDAIVSGADMVYCPVDFKHTYQSVLDAVNDGTIPAECIDEAVMRILTVKGYETEE